ncbi:GntR family transcriptional regulator [Geothrix limicola]|uniref:GntR family transcriptional regulator n=1 Tax=Geothrix limicola TaxID=2927978 RepID=A0ABQ5QH97_9BACT|nr:GntR family transcriptional regulator [Geothrix limicola]GLH73938.1 GntR family transcriptional regulator [Geothrix limicola]
MTQGNPIIVKSLREQVYEYLRAELKRGSLDTGAFLDLNRLAADLGISRTPLRDALIQLEVEEFVTISPRRGVAVRSLDLRDIQEIYQLVGALESAAVLAVGPTMTPSDFVHLKNLAYRTRRAIDEGDHEGYYESNYAFHDFFLDRLGNGRISALVHSKKQQLYDWNRKFERLHVNWEHSGMNEHEEVIRLLETGAFQEAAAYLRDVHWGFNVQESFVHQVYFQEQG